MIAVRFVIPASSAHPAAPCAARAAQDEPVDL